MKRRILIIGNGKVAVDCAHIAQLRHEVVGLVTEPASNLTSKSIFKVPASMRPLFSFSCSRGHRTTDHCPASEKSRERTDGFSQEALGG